MLTATVVTREEELLQIHELSQKNLRLNVDEETRRQEGFVTWLYSLPLLQKMHQLAPSVIAKDGQELAGYALTTLKASKEFHPDLAQLFRNLDVVDYAGHPLSSWRFYCMGQICVAREYRRQGVVNLLYQKHRELYGSHYDFILTEISTSNVRSMKAHQKIGFQTIYTYRDALDEWNVVVWDWT